MFIAEVTEDHIKLLKQLEIKYSKKEHKKKERKRFFTDVFNLLETSTKNFIISSDDKKVNVINFINDSATAGKLGSYDQALLEVKSIMFGVDVDKVNMIYEIITQKKFSKNEMNYLVSMIIRDNV